MRTALIVAVLLTAPAWVAAQEQPPPGASSCTGCHGAAGLSLQALSAAEIAAAMEAFRGGSRAATLMNRIAAGFTPAETAAIARWLAGE
jgi:cytochrome c553